MTRASATLTVGLSPCPNDTFMFHGLLAGLVPLPGLTLRPELLDIEELNRRALDPALAFAVTKLSVATFALVRERYRLLDSGAAMGWGCGPLVVGRADRPLPDLQALAGRRVAIPGEHTTAALLLRRFGPRSIETQPMRFDRVMPAVAAGEADAGVVIHESRFTYPDHGLAAVADLGALWEARTGLPLPLGVVVARRDLPGETIAAVAAGLRASIELARANRELSRDFVRAHAREMRDDVCRRHIELYVNAWSESMGEVGARAIEQLLAGEAGSSVAPSVRAR